MVSWQESGSKYYYQQKSLCAERIKGIRTRTYNSVTCTSDNLRGEESHLNRKINANFSFHFLDIITPFPYFLRPLPCSSYSELITVYLRSRSSDERWSQQNLIAHCVGLDYLNGKRLRAHCGSVVRALLNLRNGGVR